jgi:hypothetical protein
MMQENIPLKKFLRRMLPVVVLGMLAVGYALVYTSTAANANSRYWIDETKQSSPVN